MTNSDIFCVETRFFSGSRHSVAAFQNRAPRDFLTHPTKKNDLSFPDFSQKACTYIQNEHPKWKNEMLQRETLEMLQRD